MSESETIVGIDLGTTNSEIAAFVDGKVRIVGMGNAEMLPSCVGLATSGELLLGEQARNQQLLYPERTVRSIKRKMGSDITVLLGDKKFSPPEISSLILRELASWASRRTGAPVSKAVITVPAYFSDAQRQATREAGALAGLEVVRILNEPTAASLAYGYGGSEKQTVLVYDLGGGTFDVSIVTIEGDVTEVLASHGNNHLGGDDFDDLLANRLADLFEKQHGIDVRRGHPVAYARLWWAAEEAKKRLSVEPYATVREEALVVEGGKPLHFEAEVVRHDFEEMILPLVLSTIESVHKALDGADKKPRDLDAVLLVGGSTRIPLVAEVLREHTGLDPRQDLHPDLCVALGAGVLASRISGKAIEQVLVDVTPYSFGISYLGERDGFDYPYCYHPIIFHNTPLPVTRTDAYSTVYPRQDAIDVHVYQGDEEDALKNVPIGKFRIDGLKPMDEKNTVLCKMHLDIDGILHVTAIEKCTGLSKHITITDALRPKSEQEIKKARSRLEELYRLRSDGDDLDEEGEDEPLEEIDVEAVAAEPAEDPLFSKAAEDAEALLERSRRLLEAMHEYDREEAIGFHETIEDALARKDKASLDEAVEALKELLFFVEGKQ